MRTTITVYPGSFRTAPCFYLDIVGRYGFGPRQLFAGFTHTDALATALYFGRADDNPHGVVIRSPSGATFLTYDPTKVE